MLSIQRRLLQLAMGLAIAVPAMTVHSAEPIRSTEIQEIVATNTGADFESFSAFLNAVAEQSQNADLTGAIAKFSAGDELDDVDQINIARLLGIYTRVRYDDEALALLGELVAIPTAIKKDTPQYENPEIIRFGEQVANIAEAFGLAYRNIDNRIFEVELQGEHDEAFGILTHADVVPANPDNWVLDDGTKLDPYTMTVIDNRIYGRGTIDDKGSIVSALYAMKTIKENEIPLKRTIRLMIETTEETSGAGFEYYKEHNKVPDYNIVLDSDYPAVTAEKGFGTIDAYFPSTDAEGDGPRIVHIQGALATNQIPETATAEIETEAADELVAVLQPETEAFIAKHGGDFTIDIGAEDGKVKVMVRGKSAHSSEPENGINTVPRLLVFLVDSSAEFVGNHYTVAAQYVRDNFGLDYFGTQLGIAYEDAFMGPLTASPTYLELQDDGKLRMAVNLRVPRGDQSVDQLKQDIVDKLSAYSEKNNVNVTYEVSIDNWMYRDPTGAWLNTLLEIFTDTTGIEAGPVSSPGSTTAKLLPNGVNFGPNMPGEPYMGHVANEFKRLDVFNLDLQMFTEMMVRIGNLESFE